MAYIGHVRDMFLQMESALGVKDGSLSKDFKGFYAQRSHVIHGPQIPTIVDELSWLIPTISKETEISDEWHKNAIWKAMKAKGAICVVDFIRNTCAELFRLISEAHPRIFAAADHFFSGQRIEDTAIHIEFDSVGSTNVFMTDGSSDISLSAGSSTFKIRLNPSGKRDP